MISFITPSHAPQYLYETYESLRKQTNVDYEWVIVANGGQTVEGIETLLGLRESNNAAREARLPMRVRVLQLPEALNGMGIGVIKLWSFMQGIGDYLAELDHDDLLVPTAVQDILDAFKTNDVDFVYSNSADFFPNGNGHWYPQWQENNWLFRDAHVNGTWYNEAVAFEPSAASLGLIYYAPNHIRVWKREFYRKIEGHNPNMRLADDHELLVRTYLKGRMYHLDKLLYLYRMGEQNTFSKSIPEISRLTHEIYVKNIEALILREAELRGLPCYDLGGAIDCPPGWQSVDLHQADINCDLNEQWPFADNSVFAFRGHDIIEHLPNKQHTMSELHRCLVPDGWALLQVPSALGQGGFMDPTHCSYWVENSFKYYTEPELARYIRNKSEHFIAQRLFSFNIGEIPYVKAELRAIKGGRGRFPGYSRFT